MIIVKQFRYFVQYQSWSVSTRVKACSTFLWCCLLCFTLTWSKAPVRTKENLFVLPKKSVNRKPFLVRTIFPPTKIFSAVTKIQSCRREDLEAYNFLSGDKIPCSFTAILRRVILFRVSRMRRRLQKQKIGDHKIFTFLVNFLHFLFVVLRTWRSWVC